MTPDMINGAKEAIKSPKSIEKNTDLFAGIMKENTSSLGSTANESGNMGEFAVPSMAAFHLRYDLGLPIEVHIPVSMQEETLAQSKELEAHTHAERLLPAFRSGGLLNKTSDAKRF